MLAQGQSEIYRRQSSSFFSGRSKLLANVSRDAQIVLTIFEWPLPNFLSGNSLISCGQQYLFLRGQWSSFWRPTVFFRWPLVSFSGHALVETRDRSKLLSQM